MFRNKYIRLISFILGIAGFIFLSGCATAPANGSTGSSGFDWTFLIFMVVILAVFYFLMIRPQRSRQKQQRQMLSELKVGDQIVTSAGIYGEITSLEEDSAVIKIESGATMRLARPSIVGKRGLN